MAHALLQTTVVLAAFLTFMVKHPDVLKKAQAEVDRVVGSDRLPTVADRPNLPYVEAVFAEVFRMKAPISLRECPQGRFFVIRCTLTIRWQV